MQIVHAFPETDRQLMISHMRYWFGRPYNDEYTGPDGSYMACHCGGLLIPLQREGGDIKVGAIWHEKSFEDRNGD